MAFAPVNLWKPEYLLDVASMDVQHSHFFRILDVLSQVCERSDKASLKNAHVIALVTEIRRYSQKHFHDEEAMLAKYGYPQLPMQCREHDAYQRYVLEFINDKIDLYSLDPEEAVTAQNVDLISDLLAYVALWWDEHILKKDILYVEYVKKVKRSRITPKEGNPPGQ